MNWIKGFDRIFLVFAIPIFILTLGWVLWNIQQNGVFHSFLGEPNPAYEEWEQEYGKGKYWNRFNMNGLDGVYFFSDDPSSSRPIPSPPERYLPIKTYKKILCAVGVGIGASVVWLGVLCGTTRLIRITGKFISTGFKR